MDVWKRSDMKRRVSKVEIPNLEDFWHTDLALPGPSGAAQEALKTSGVLEALQRPPRRAEFPTEGRWKLEEAAAAPVWT